VAALGVAIHHVVVQQREVVHQLDGDGTRDAHVCAGAGQLGGQQRERRPDRFAAPGQTCRAVRIGPAQVVAGDVAAGGIQPGDGGPHGG